MNVLEKICEKLAAWESSINEIPVEKRKGIILKVLVVLFILLLVCTFGNQMYRSHVREAKKEQLEISQKNIDPLSKQIDAELSTLDSGTKEKTDKAKRLIDSLTKNKKGYE